MKEPRDPLIPRLVFTSRLLLLPLALTSCRVPQPEFDDCLRRATDAEVRRMQAAVVIREVPSRPVDGFYEHWRKGTQTALYNWSKVLVRDSTRPTMLEISGLPKEYGYVSATGWKDGERFFVHLRTGPDGGTMVSMDLERRRVTEMVHWSGW